MPTNKEKKETKRVKEQIMLQPAMVWDKLTPKEKKDAFTFAEEYKRFLNLAKTEREAVVEIEKCAKKSGFKKATSSPPQSKIYKAHRKKAIGLAVIGKRSPVEGLRIVVSHIDSPRLDLKQNPLYEEVSLAFFKTHYYGGIKKYQWVSRPLALHGKVVKKDGKELDVKIGEDEGDPVFTIADLLPHLARKTQYDKKLGDAIAGEKLNVLVGSIPYPDKETQERIKLQVLDYLHRTFGLVEEDFVSAELELVPAEKARDIGWDRSFIGSYGQDDRVCAYSSLRAISEATNLQTTGLVLFLDKEEIGSEGNTSARSRFLEEMVADVFKQTGTPLEEHLLKRALMNSYAISADVNGALDPDYQEVHEKRNAAKLGYGVCITKYTGSGGKYASSDANAEYVGMIRRLFNQHNIVWQTGELGKVDEGGGGTVAKFLASYGMEIIDCGTSLLGMHSPFEISSKADAYMTYKAYKIICVDFDMIE
ncbi:MAG: aminopeptidase [Deltaproteobacteria bacterium]|nr:aminopeptidase [Deltaproteobacteria bacterium]